MVQLTSLWLPILLSAVLVFIASSIIHMVIGYHGSDFKRLPDEDGMMEALRSFNLPPGDYQMPCAGGAKGMKSPEFQEKYKKGPIALITIAPPGSGMGSSLILWFIYSILIGVFAGYIAGHALTPGAYYLSVFRYAGSIAFASYSIALLQNSIWFKKSWGATFRSMFDGLIYALLTAGVFGWLWPK